VQSVPSGTGVFSGTGLFTTTIYNGSPCAGKSCGGTWSYTVDVNFATRVISASYTISSLGIAGFEHASGPLNYAQLQGSANWTTTNSSISTANFQLYNSGGLPAQLLQGTASYSAGSGITAVKGVGSAVTSSR
jgi:hypothetical protein